MPRGPDWKPIKTLRSEVRLLKQLHLKYVSRMTRFECKKFIKYFGPVPTGHQDVTHIDVPNHKGAIIEYDGSEDDKEYDD
jgi:hypothetical protein